MDKRRKNSPIRFLKRNTLYILLIVLICALIAALALMTWQIIKSVSPKEPEAPVTEKDPVQQTQVQPETTLPPQQVVVEPNQAAPTEDVQAQFPGAFEPPFDGTTKFLSNQKLALTYDSSKLQLEEKDGLYSLTGKDGQSLPRLDLESLPTSLDALTSDEREELAVRLMQACYYVAPATADITCTVTANEENNFSITLTAPAHLDAPAMTAKVRLMQVRDTFWYAIALIPEGNDGSAIEQAIDNLIIR